MQKSSRTDHVAEVKTATDIVEVVGAYLDLRPAGGARFKALCPFHQEKTPSFHVTRDRQIFHCFGCGKGGDALSFLQEIDGLTFPEALQNLADRAGIRLPEYRGSDSGRKDEKEALHKLGSFAARHYVECLHDSLKGGHGRTTLGARGLNEATIQKFELGYVPDEWRSLTDAAREAGHSERLLEALGLAKRGEKGGLYDHFRNRLMFPIRDVSGRIVAFGGRDLGDGPAKYINSPENPVYRKSHVLYGLHEARDAIRSTGEAILVEGYFDLLRCFDAGIENVVATCGTALTAEHATLICRYAPKVLIVFDGDEAGVRAALRSVGVLTSAGLSVRALTLPDSADPDDYIREHGAESFQRLATEAPDFIAFYVRMNTGRTETIEGRTGLARELFAVLRDMGDVLRQDEYLKVLARELDLDEGRAREAYSAFLREKRQGVARTSKSQGSGDGVSVLDRDFISILMARPQLLELAHAKIADLNLSEDPVVEVVGALAQASQIQGLEGLENEAARCLYSAAATVEDRWGENAEELVNERVARFKKDALRGKSARLQEEINRAQRLEDDQTLIELTLKKIDIDKEIQGG